MSTDKNAIQTIISHQRAERNEFGGKLMQALRDAMPWGLEVDLGNGQIARLVPMNGKADASQPSRAPIYESREAGRPITTEEAEEAKIIGYDDWSFSFDWKLENCDQDHIEVTTHISGGGGMA